VTYCAACKWLVFDVVFRANISVIEHYLVFLFHWNVNISENRMHVQCRETRMCSLFVCNVYFEF